MVTRAVTTNDGVCLHVEDFPGGGRPVVLLAGFTAPASTWAWQVEALVDAGYRVVCVDRRSHGRSQTPTYGQRMARHGKDLHDVLTALGLNRPVLVGGSMGASTIWAYLDLFGSDAIGGVASIDQTPCMLNTADWPYGFYGLIAENLGTFFAAGIPDTHRGLDSSRAQASVGRLIERLGGVPQGFGTIRRETLPLLRDHAAQDWRDVVARTDVPTLVLAGRDSQFWPCERAAATAEAAPQGHAVVVEDCGHAVNIDRPAETNRILRTFLADA